MTFRPSPRAWAIAVAAVAILAAFLVARSRVAARGPTPGLIRIGASAVPHAEILEFVKPALAKRGIDLQIRVFDDYVQPNLALADGAIDANFFQHVPYLDEFQKARPLGIVASTKVHIEPIALFSKRVSRLADLAPGNTIAIPNDPSNSGRALRLLAKANLITLDEGAGIRATLRDVRSNPKELRFTELDAAQLPRVLPDVAAAVINANYAFEAGLNPVKDGLIIENEKSPYANVLAVLPPELQNPDFIALQAALTSEDVRQFIVRKYGGSVLAAF